MLLGVNIDHIAVLREARAINDPDPLDALSILKQTKATQVTIHLREDRRHIDDFDTERIVQNSHLPVNLECSINRDIIDIACRIKPYRVTLVPEKREEVTTEGGLDIRKYFQEIEETIEKLKSNSIEVSLFVDPDIDSIKFSKDLNSDIVELHTGSYANIYAMLFSNLSKSKHSIEKFKLPRNRLKIELDNSISKLKQASKYADKIGLRVAAGHGLNYQNVKEIAKIPEIFELNIGQSIIARSVFVGFERAIEQMVEILEGV